MFWNRSPKPPEVDTRFRCKGKIIRRAEFMHEGNTYILIRIKLQDEAHPDRHDTLTFKRHAHYREDLALCREEEVVTAYGSTDYDGKVVLYRVDFADHAQDQP